MYQSCSKRFFILATSYSNKGLLFDQSFDSSEDQLKLRASLRPKVNSFDAIFIQLFYEDIVRRSYLMLKSIP